MSMISHSLATHHELRRRLRDIEPDLDEETLADTLEGLTDLHELLAAVLRAALADEAIAAGLRELVKTMQARLGRIEERASARRLIVRDAMIEADIRKIVAPDATISVRPGSPAVVILDEHAVPPDYTGSRASPASTAKVCSRRSRSASPSRGRRCPIPSRC
jgi:hypothetical protein